MQFPTAGTEGEGGDSDDEEGEIDQDAGNAQAGKFGSGVAPPFHALQSVTLPHTFQPVIGVHAKKFGRGIRSGKGFGGSGCCAL